MYKLASSVLQSLLEEDSGQIVFVKRSYKSWSFAAQNEE